MSYVQLYWDGDTVKASYLAMHALKSGFTTSAKVPLKKIRLDKTQNKGFNLRPPFCITELDDNYTDLLCRIDRLKDEMDSTPQVQFTDSSLNMYHTASDTYSAFMEQMDYRWHILRWLHHAQHYIITDMDIFDSSMRLFSYNIHEPVLQTKRIKGNASNNTLVVGHIVDNAEFNTIVFLTKILPLVSLDSEIVAVEADEQVKEFIDKISKNTAILQNRTLASLEGDEIRFTIDTHGTRLYDEAERPVRITDGASPWKSASVSFVILADETSVTLEAVDVFLSKYKQNQQIATLN
jgi:hypothetical protein